MPATRTHVTAAAAVGVLLACPGTAAAAPTRQAPTTTRPASVAAAAANVLSDGNFAYPSTSPNLFLTFTAGQSIGPWQVTSGDVDLVSTGYWQATAGGQSVDLNGLTTGAIAQTFATTPGTKYTVTYSLAGNPIGPPAVKTGEALIDGQDYQDFSFDTTGKTTTNMGYSTRGFTFVATGPSTTLTFASTTAGNSAWGPVLDNVVVQPLQMCSCA